MNENYDIFELELIYEAHNMEIICDCYNCIKYRELIKEQNDFMDRR